MIRIPVERRCRQRGTSLIFALVALCGLSVACAAMMRSADATSMVAGSLGFQQTATRATELAIEAGIGGVTALSVAGRESNSAAANYFASLEAVNLEPTAARLSTSTDDAVVDAQTGNTARYVVERMCSNTGAAAAATCVIDGGLPVYRVTALAVGPRFTSETTQSVFTINIPLPACGIMMQQSVTVSGQSQQSGTSKCYHSNTDMLVSGEMLTAGLEASAGGSSSYTGGGAVAVTVTSSAPARTLPTVNPSAHKPYARQTFKADGTVTGSGFAPGAWTWSSGLKLWTLNTDFDTTLPPQGLYYFESNVEIPKKIGQSGAPARLSIVADLSIKISGTVYLRDFTDTTTPHPQATNQVFIMAGGDLELPGGSQFLDVNHSSMMAAGAEFKVNGSIVIEANLVARNETAPTGSMNWASENTVSGTLTQTYDGDGASLTPTPTRRLWRVVTR